MDGTAGAVMALENPRSQACEWLTAAVLPNHPLPEQRSHQLRGNPCWGVWAESREGSHADFFSSLAFTNSKRAFQAKPRLLSMKLERLWFLPVGVWELAPGSTCLWARALQVLLPQNGLEVLCSLQQCTRSEEGGNSGGGKWHYLSCTGVETETQHPVLIRQSKDSHDIHLKSDP